MTTPPTTIMDITITDKENYGAIQFCFLSALQELARQQLQLLKQEEKPLEIQARSLWLEFLALQADKFSNKALEEAEKKREAVTHAEANLVANQALQHWTITFFQLEDAT